MRSLPKFFVVLLVSASVGQCGELTKTADTVEATRNCGEGWLYSLQLNGCYYVSTNYTAFEESVTFCEDLGGTLLSVLDDAEYDIVSLFVEQEDLIDPYWIGLKPYSYYPYFRWLDNANANYAHWLGGITPSPNDTETCFAWLKTPTDNGWLNADCNRKLPFICKRHPRVDRYTIINGGDFARFKSPNHPKPYFADSVSEYYIGVDAGYRISVTFDVLNIDPKSKIFVYENSTLINTITSRSRPPVIEAYSNQLLLRFEASKEGNEKYTGWKATYNQFATITTEGSLSSSDYSNSHSQITKVVTVPKNYILTFNFLSFHGESIYDCLSLAYRGSRIFNLSGPNVTTPFTLNTTYSEAEVSWRSGSSISFNLTYVAVPYWH
uniref:C-type lectin domain-containing protein n=1 Tax=Panagrellus redivivus TaxID=6233 RepID=A0A7E4V2Q7_PANRE